MKSSAGSATARLRVITWNVWFNEWQRDLRQRALWSELEALDPDVICLQEVVSSHLDGPEIHELRDRGFWVSNRRIWGYDVIVVSRLPVLDSERVPLPSVMGRELLVVHLDTNPALTVATVHLESTNEMTDFRCQQLAEIHKWLENQADVLLVGDMNFPAGERPEAAFLPGWTDVWQSLRPDDPGFTVDSKLNVMRGSMKPGQKKRARIDRVFHRGARWRPVAIERLGTKPIATDPPDPSLFISDHFGLCVDLDSSQP